MVVVVVVDGVEINEKLDSEVAVAAAVGEDAEKSKVWGKFRKVEGTVEAVEEVLKIGGGTWNEEEVEGESSGEEGKIEEEETEEVPEETEAVEEGNEFIVLKLKIFLLIFGISSYKIFSKNFLSSSYSSLLNLTDLNSFGVSLKVTLLRVLSIIYGVKSVRTTGEGEEEDEEGGWEDVGKAEVEEEVEVEDEGEGEKFSIKILWISNLWLFLSVNWLSHLFVLKVL